jgi:xanthine dehydrogenase molybdopterin-binding subunit B
VSNRTYTIDIEFHNNGRLKSVKNTYTSEYGSMSDVLTKEVTERVIKLIDNNRIDPKNIKEKVEEI